MLGAGRFAELVIVPPQVAIIGAGRIHEAVTLHDGATPTARRLLPISLTFDHRSGGGASRFLAAMIADLGRAT